jgi:RNA 2',3'-cyclic 3'-phosphodiesterase
MSLFVAIRPDDDAVADLDEAVRRVQRLPDAQPLRWQAARHWHVTLAFLGEPDADTALEVAERLADAVRSQPEIPGLRLAGAGSFGRQILWIGLGGEAEVARLADIATSLRSALRGSGAVVDRKPWRAHLTIARARNGDVHQCQAAIADYRGPTWTARELLLIRSTGGPSPAHQLIHVEPLPPAVTP